MNTRSNLYLHLSLTLLTCLIAILLSVRQKTTWFTTPITHLFNPLRAPLFHLRSSLDQQISFIREIPHHQRLVKDLERQLTESHLQAQKAAELERENAKLRSLLPLASSTSRTLLPVKVIGLSRHAIINQGSQANLEPGLAVVSDGVLVGIIDKVNPNSALVQLITDSKTHLDAVTSAGALGQVTFDSNLKLTQVLQKEPLETEDAVYTKGSELIPDNLLIGKVTKLHDNPSSIYKQADLTPQNTIHDQEVVFVILK